MAQRDELNGTDYEWFGRQQKKEQGKEGRGGVGFLVKKNLEVVKEGKEGNLLWMSVGKQEPWHLALVYMSRKTEVSQSDRGVARRCRRLVVLGDFNSRIGEIPNVMIGEDG